MVGKKIAAAVLALGLIAAPAARAQAGVAPWADLALGDLRALRAALEANHPGPVDPRNPGFRAWLNDGYETARAEAAKAKSFSDYRRALTHYEAGFRDGHVALTFLVDATRAEWPGFLVASDERRRVEVRSGQPPEPLAVRDELVSCDGVSAADLLRTWIDPYYGNAAIPQSLREHSARLFLPDGADTPRLFRRCRFRHAGEEVDVALTWQRMLASDAAARLAEAQQAEVSPLGVTRTGPATVISVPSFNLFSQEQAAQMRGVLAKTAKLADGPVVVVDLRGNRGGDSTWAQELARTLWGPAVADAVLAQQDTRVDWRVSPANQAAAEFAASRARGLGQAETAAYRAHVAQLLRDAAAKGLTLVSDGDPPAPPGPLPKPRLGRVYVFTDNACFSACLDFMDIALKIPGVVHIGLPTSADTRYIDNTDVALPSGITRLSYSMKVYRNRERQDNAWHTPRHAWPGGPMSPEAIARWAGELAAQAP